MKIVIIRHGEPDYVHDSLTEKGFREAELLAERISKLDVKNFYCSPLGRAKATAAPTLKLTGRTATELDWLHEFKGKVREGIKVTNCWDRMPSYWTADESYYDKSKWFDTKLLIQN